MMSDIMKSNNTNNMNSSINNEFNKKKLEVSRVDMYPMETGSRVVNEGYLPPQPLTTKELNYYQMARENALRRRKRVENEKSFSTTNIINPLNSSTMVNAVTPVRTVPRNSHSQADNRHVLNNASFEAGRVNPISRVEKERRDYVKHIEKQRYYDSRYADDLKSKGRANGRARKTTASSYIDSQGVNSNSGSSENFGQEHLEIFNEKYAPKKKSSVLSFLKWLILLLLFTTIGYGLAFLIFEII